MDYPNRQRDRANMSRDSATQRPSHRKALRPERTCPMPVAPTVSPMVAVPTKPAAADHQLDGWHGAKLDRALLRQERSCLSRHRRQR
jgi:hypothetical protein